MIARTHTRIALLRGCAPTALAAAALAFAPPAAAQGFQAGSTVLQGSVGINNSQPNITTVTVGSQDAVIQWNPQLDNAGNPLEFLPQGNTGIFQNDPQSVDFAVLNIIVPTQAGTPAVFNGLVQSLIIDNSGTNPGGFVAFYSQTGILVGATGRFEVPQLVLTSQEPDISSFTDFATGSGPLVVGDVAGGPFFNNGAITIATGGSISATPEDSYFVAIAPSIAMAGDVRVNGSVAYVAAAIAQLTHSSGLFDIVIPVGAGTAAPTPIDHSGSTGGPASSGAGDDHVIYAVTQSAAFGSPISMLFSGNLGFDAAANASVVNGDIILSGNYNAAGRSVDGEDNRQGVDSFFDGRGETSGSPVNIFIDDLDATSNLLAIGNGQTALGGGSDFSDNVVLVGRDGAFVSVSGGNLAVAGDLFLSSRGFGRLAQSAGEENAAGGIAEIVTDVGGSIVVGGATFVTADAVAGQDLQIERAGEAFAGEARIWARGGSIQLDGPVTISADAYTDQSGIFSSSGEYTGGLGELIAGDGETLVTGTNVLITASAQTPELSSSFSPMVSSPATGGTINIDVGSDVDGGVLDIGGSLQAESIGTVGNTLAVTGTAGAGQGGDISAIAFADSTFSVGSGMILRSQGFGGDIDGDGTGGAGASGIVELLLTNSDFSADFVVFESLGQGGDGLNGGAATSGTSVFDSLGSTSDIGSSLTLSAEARGGNARGTSSSGPGAAGAATGGDAQLILGASSDFATGSQVDVSTEAFGGDAEGGTGGAAVGGDVVLSVSGNSSFDANGQNIDISAGAIGGGTADGSAGDAAAGSISVAVDNSLADFGNSLNAQAVATGGLPSGAGTAGAASGGLVDVLIANNSDVTFGALATNVEALAFSGGTAGTADGGNTSFAVDMSQVSGGSLNMVADASAQSGDATGGSIVIQGDNDADVDFVNADLSADASGGPSSIATGGSVDVTVSSGGNATDLGFSTATISVDADGSSNDAVGNFNIVAEAGELRFNTLDISAIADLGPNDESAISAPGGTLRIGSALNVAQTADLEVSYSGGGIILGGSTVNDLSANFDVSATGVLTLGGDDNSSPGILAQTARFASSDIAIGAAASVAGDALTFESLETQAAAIIGGTAGGSGYTLDQVETDNLVTPELRFVLPATNVGGPDAFVDDLTLGAGGNDFDLIQFTSDGRLEVIGELVFANATVDDALVIETDVFTMSTDLGSIAVQGANGGLDGTFALTARQAVVAGLADIDTILADPTDASVPTLLAEDPVANSAGFYLSAASVDLIAEEFLLFKNTGINGEFDGIRVRPDGLSIAQSAGQAAPLRVIVYGQSIDANGALTTGNSFFDATNLAGTLSGPFTDDATLNDCEINTGICPIIPGPAQGPAVDDVINNEVLLRGPVGDDGRPALTGAADAGLDPIFGIEFPSLIDAPLISEDEIINDPVTSGGDSAALAATSRSDDDEDDGNEN